MHFTITYTLEGGLFHDPPPISVRWELCGVPGGVKLEPGVDGAVNQGDAGDTLDASGGGGGGAVGLPRGQKRALEGFSEAVLQGVVLDAVCPVVKEEMAQLKRDLTHDMQGGQGGVTAKFTYVSL